VVAAWRWQHPQLSTFSAFVIDFSGLGPWPSGVELVQLFDADLIEFSIGIFLKLEFSIRFYRRRPGGSSDFKSSLKIEFL